MFTQAMFSLIIGELKCIGFSFDPKEINKNFDIVVVPAANWLNRNADWDWFLDRLEGLTIPVVVIGLGLQADGTAIREAEVSDSALRLAQFFSARAAQISVRGDLTKQWLESKGITNVVSTGCPSLYMNIFSNDELTDSKDIVFQSTRYGASRSFADERGINRRVFSFCIEFGMPMIFQSEPEEIGLIVYGRSVSSLDEKRQVALLNTYGVEAPSDLDRFLKMNGRVFFSLSDWSAFLRQSAGVVGTRLHGSILALNSGRQAMLIPHDSRTAEIARLAAIPTAFGPDVVAMQSFDELRCLLSSANLELYKDRRSSNQVRFIQFLADVGLTARTQNMF